MARLFLFRSELWSTTQLSCDTVLSAQDTIFHLKIYLHFSALSFWSVLTKRTLKNCQSFNLKQKPPFSPPTNSKGAKENKSYTRNSFRPGHRADLHVEHSNHATEPALCSASRSDSIKLNLSFHPAHSSAGDQPQPRTDRSFHMPTFPSFRALWSGLTPTSGEWIYCFFPLLFVVFSHLASAL